MFAHCAQILPANFPQATFYFLPADITAQILNFGLPAPIDIRFEATTSRAASSWPTGCWPACVRSRAWRISASSSRSTIHARRRVERTKASQGGFTERDVTNSVLNTLAAASRLRRCSSSTGTTTSTTTWSARRRSTAWIPRSPGKHSHQSSGAARRHWRKAAGSEASRPRRFSATWRRFIAMKRWRSSSTSTPAGWSIFTPLCRIAA